MREIAKKAKEENHENPEAEGLNSEEIDGFKNLQAFLNEDPYTPKQTEDAHMNFKMINACVKFSAFRSQSLEKLYCYYVTLNIPSSDFIVHSERYNERLGRIF